MVTRSLPGAVGTLIALAVATISPLGAQANPDKALFGKWGFDATGADLRTRPGKNFFRYANGAWLEATPIPADKSSYSVWTAIADRTQEHLRDIMQTAPKMLLVSQASWRGRSERFTPPSWTSRE